MAKAIKCAVCGQLFVAQSNSAKYCSTCRKEANNRRERERWHKKQAERAALRVEVKQKAQAVASPVIKTVDDYCNGCVYLTGLSCDATKHRACFYVVETSTRRPCPAGKGCTERETGPKKRYVDLPVI